MTYMIAVFKSRRDALEFAAVLSRHRVQVRAVNTPPSISEACGLSVRFPKGAISIAQSVLAVGEYYSFKGFYSI